MAVDTRREGNNLVISTYDLLGNGRTYRPRVYETPDGTEVVVNSDLTDRVIEELEREGYDVRDEKPDRYKWHHSAAGTGPGPNHDGIFTIEEKAGTAEPGATVYETDCGQLITTTDLEVGETYETYHKDVRHFGYRTVDS